MIFVQLDINLKKDRRCRLERDTSVEILEFHYYFGFKYNNTFLYSKNDLEWRL